MKIVYGPKGTGKTKIVFCQLCVHLQRIERRVAGIFEKIRLNREIIHKSALISCFFQIKYSIFKGTENSVPF